jgi:hypothetical protein
VEPARCRYIGVTSGTLEHRLRRHINEAVGGKLDNFRCRWLRKLLAAGRKPTITVLQLIEQHATVDTWSQACELERLCIKLYRLAGHQLTNSTEGGEGMLGWKPSPETRERMSAARQNLGPALRAKVAAALRGRTRSQETRRKLSAANKGKTLSKEARSKIGTAHRGKPKSEAHRAAISVALLKRYSDPLARLAVSAARRRYFMNRELSMSRGAVRQRRWRARKKASDSRLR